MKQTKYGDKITFELTIRTINWPTDYIGVFYFDTMPQLLKFRRSHEETERTEGIPAYKRSTYSKETLIHTSNPWRL